MQIQCDYCGQFINDTDSVCPYCGGTNTHLKRMANNVPVTIEELKAFCIAHNLPLSQMRFFIGENYTGARAFGIYKDEQSGNFIVYKNKSDGSRAIRYEGKDEAYAVNELYQKIKSEMTNQKQMRASNRPVQPVSRPTRQGANTYRNTSKRIGLSIFLIIMTIIILYGMFRGMQGLVYFGGFPYNCYNGYQPYTYSNWDSENNNSNWGDDWDDNDSWDDNSGWGNDWGDDGGWNDDSGWDNDWDSDWDYGSDWDSDWSDWDSDW